MADARDRPTSAGLVNAQPVALTPQSLDTAPVKRLVDLAPQVTHVDLDNVPVAFEIFAPYRIEQLRLADDLVRVVEQIGEHLHFSRGQVDHDSPNEATPAQRIEAKIANRGPINAAG